MDQSKKPEGIWSTNKLPFTIVIVSVVLITLIVGGVIFERSNQKQDKLHNEITSQKQTQPTSTTTVNQTPAQPDLSNVFELNKKESGTKIYFSEKLGVGFTFLSLDVNSPVKVTETENRIIVADQTIEVFTKDPNISLEQAIKDKFLQTYSPSDCFVKTYETNEQNLANYVSAGISFPATDDPNEPWWTNSEKCPQDYSETNGIQYFLMNKDVPEKFIFVRIGQYPAASDGTPQTETDGFNWTHSIQILK